MWKHALSRRFTRAMWTHPSRRKMEGGWRGGMGVPRREHTYTCVDSLVPWLYYTQGGQRGISVFWGSIVEHITFSRRWLYDMICITHWYALCPCQHRRACHVLASTVDPSRICIVNYKNKTSLQCLWPASRYMLLWCIIQAILLLVQPDHAIVNWHDKTSWQFHHQTKAGPWSKDREGIS